MMRTAETAERTIDGLRIALAEERSELEAVRQRVRSLMDAHEEAVAKERWAQVEVLEAELSVAKAEAAALEREGEAERRALEAELQALEAAARERALEDYRAHVEVLMVAVDNVLGSIEADRLRRKAPQPGLRNADLMPACPAAVPQLLRGWLATMRRRFGSTFGKEGAA